MSWIKRASYRCTRFVSPGSSASESGNGSSPSSRLDKRDADAHVAAESALLPPRLRAGGGRRATGEAMEADAHVAAETLARTTRMDIERVSRAGE